VPTRRARRSAATRESLFRAALDLFAAKGFADTTVEDITEAADVGKGTFFNYFPSKEHLLAAFSDMQLAKLQTAIEFARQNQEPMPSFLRALGVNMTAEPARNPSIVRALLQANLSGTVVRDLMRENHARALALMTDLIALGQQRGEIRGDLPASDIANVFRQMVFGTLLLWSVYGDGSLSARIHTAFDLLWHGLAPRLLSPNEGESSDRQGPSPGSHPL
jgi:AcrR family transcriptional regulator